MNPKIKSPRLSLVDTWTNCQHRYGQELLQIHCHNNGIQVYFVPLSVFVSSHQLPLSMLCIFFFKEMIYSLSLTHLLASSVATVTSSQVLKVSDYGNLKPVLKSVHTKHFSVFISIDSFNAFFFVL